MTHLCQCNNCGAILYDENPSDNSREYTHEEIDATCAPEFMVFLEDEEGFSMGCPNCETDGYLVDLTEDLDKVC
jgi:hypothetical protein